MTSTKHIFGVNVIDGFWRDSLIVGFEWDQNTDEVRQIDEFGETISPTTDDFDHHPLWGMIRRCTLSDAGTVNHYGANPRGDGLTLDGSDGRVMTEIPKVYVKSLEFAPHVYQWWFSPDAHPGFVIDPAFVQRGGTERDHIYVGSFLASLNLKNRDHTDNTMQLDSKYVLDASSNPCTQPFTGGTSDTPTIFGVDFTSGSREFVVGEVLTNNALDAKVIDWYISSGTFAGGDAAGTLYCQVFNDPWAGGNWAAGAITDSGATDIATASGAPSHKTLTEANCRTYTTTNIGSRWGFVNIHTYNLLRRMMYCEWGSLDSQTAIGRGIVDKASGDGFNGEYIGIDSINTNVAPNGTGTGTGTNGLTPISWRSITDLWGNAWWFVDGYEALDAAFHIINRDGTGMFANPMAPGDYESSIAAPTTTDGYQSDIEYEDLLKYLMIPNAVSGSTSTYLCDYLYAHDIGETNILIAGSNWADGSRAGVYYAISNRVASESYYPIGARIEFI